MERSNENKMHSMQVHNLNIHYQWTQNPVVSNHAWNRMPQQLQKILKGFLNERYNSWGEFRNLQLICFWFLNTNFIIFISEVGGSRKWTTKTPFILALSGVGENTKYCPFIVSLKVDKPAADCELEPNNQSAVVSIVMLSPIGKKEWQKGHIDSLHHVYGSCVIYIYKEINPLHNEDCMTVRDVSNTLLVCGMGLTASLNKGSDLKHRWITWVNNYVQ